MSPARDLFPESENIAPHFINTVCGRDVLGDLVVVRQFLAFRENENLLLCAFPVTSRWLCLRSLVGAAPVQAGHFRGHGHWHISLARFRRFAVATTSWQPRPGP